MRDRTRSGSILRAGQLGRPAGVTEPHRPFRLILALSKDLGTRAVGKRISTEANLLDRSFDPFSDTVHYGEQVIPRVRVLLPVSRDQRLVARAEIELHAAPHAVEGGLAGPAFDKQGAQHAAAKRGGQFAA